MLFFPCQCIRNWSRSSGGTSRIIRECSSGDRVARLGSGFIIFKGGKQGMQEARRYPMRTLFYLSENQLERIKPFFPRSHGALRVDDRRVVSDIIYVIKHGLQWKDVPDEYRPHRSLYNRLVRWSKRGVFKKNFNKLSNQTPFDGSLMLDSPTLRLTARRQVYSKRGFSTSHLPNKRRPKFQTSCRL